MQVVEIHEAVKVRADFQGGRITPLYLKRGGRTHRLTRVNARWVDRDGRQPRHYFSVTDTAGDVYQLVLRGEDMVWMLENVTVP